ncbi:hypothetical protein ABBQ38_000607 [Trebouxia sp. C0009 RCD-2024]
MARMRCTALFCLLAVLACSTTHVLARDQVDVAGLPVEEQLTSYKNQAAEFWKQVQDLEASKSKLQKEFKQNEVSVQTLQSVVKEQQKRVSALEAELKAKDSEYGGLQAKLVELQGKVTGASSGAQEDAVKAEAKVQDLQGRLKLAEQDKAAAEQAQKAAEKEAANRQKEVDKAADHIAKLSERVRKAEAGQAEAHNKLASAGVEASSARKLVDAAEAKAAAASAQAQEYYHKLQNSWTPHWLQQKWTQGGTWASRTLLSDKSGKQNSVGQYVTLARAKLLAFWSATRDFLFHTHKHVSPHLLTAKKHGIKTWAQSKKHGLKVWLASKKHTNTFLSSPQVRNVQKKVAQLQKDGEKVLRTQMKKYPALQPYAKTPYTTYILRLGVLLPLFIFLGPLLGLIGSLGRRRPASAPVKQKKVVKPRASTSGAPTPQRASRRESGKIISEGSETIRVP